MDSGPMARPNRIALTNGPCALGIRLRKPKSGAVEPDFALHSAVNVANVANPESSHFANAHA